MRTCFILKPVRIPFVLFHVLAWYYQLFVRSATNPVSFLAPAISISRQRNNGITINDFVSLRSGREGSTAVWYHRGLIRNPFTGAEVAGIEGIEITSNLPNNAPSSGSKPSDRVSLRKWESADAEVQQLYGFNNTYTARYLTKKLFIYVDANERDKALTEFRVRAGSPAKNVQSAKKMTELVCVGVDHSSGRQFAHIQWPGGRTIWANRIRIASTSALLDRLMGTVQYDVTSFIAAVKRKKMKKWISFAPDSSSSSSGGSQEYYSLRQSSLLPFTIEAIPALLNPRRAATDVLFSGTKSSAATAATSTVAAVKADVHNNNNSTIPKHSRVAKKSFLQRLPPRVVMSYKRYGEAPPWYAVGRSCVIEMRSERYPSVYRLPPAAQRLFYDTDPTFFYDVEEEKKKQQQQQQMSNPLQRLAASFSPQQKQLKRLQKQLQKQAALTQKEQLWLSQGKDLLDDYPEWYARLNPFKKQKK